MSGDMFVVLVLVVGVSPAVVEIEVAGVAVVAVLGLVGGSGHLTVSSKVSLKTPFTGFGL